MDRNVILYQINFVPLQGSGAPAPAPNGPSSGQMSEKPPPVPWQQLTSTFKTTSEAKPGTAPLIAANTTLEQDKETVLRCWLAMGGEDDKLRRRYYVGEWRMRDEPSDDASEWYGVVVAGGRVKGLEWVIKDLTGTIPTEIGALSALTYLFLDRNELSGAIPPTIGALSSLTSLDLSNNSLSGVVPYSFSNLLNLEYLGLSDNNFSSGSDDLNNKREVRDYFNSLWRHPTIRLLNYGIAITKKRQDSLSTTTTTSTTLPPPPPHPFFTFLADYEDSLTDLIMSFLDPVYCCKKDCATLLMCWRLLGGAEDKLRQGYGDDVARWEGVWVKDGRVVEVFWAQADLKGNLPSEIGELDGLRKLNLEENEISSIPSEIGKLTSLRKLNLDKNEIRGVPSEIGKLTSLTKLSLYDNHLADLPCELGNLRSLTKLNLDNNRLSVLASNLANLTNLHTLWLDNNNLTIDVPSDESDNSEDNEKVQTFLATLKSTDQN